MIALDDVNEAMDQVIDGTAPAPRMVFRIPPLQPRTDSDVAAASAT